MSRLRITYDGSEDYDEWLEIRLTGPFSGIGGFYDRPDAFADFADRLSAYLLDPERPPLFEHGHVVLKVVPFDSVGNLRFVIEIGEFYDSDNRVRVNLPATYAGIQDFQRALQSFIEDPSSAFEFDIR